MSFNLENVWDELATILPWTLPVISTCSGAGTATTLIDAALLIDKSTTGGRWSADSFNGLWIYRPAAAGVGDRQRNVKDSGLAISTGTLTQAGNDWAVSPASSERYLIATLQPRILYNLLVTVMRELKVPAMGPLRRFTDADMEDSGTASYSISGAGALTKATAAANVFSGGQSLFLNAATAGEYVESPSLVVQAGQLYFASCIARVDAGGPFAFAIWDKTNDAEIENANRVSHSLEAFMSIQRTFTPPSTCEEVALRGYVTGATDDVYIDCFQGPWYAGDRTMRLPTWLTNLGDFRSLRVARYAHQVSTGLYDAASAVYVDELQRPSDYQVRTGPVDASIGRLEWSTTPPLAELWMEGLRSANDIWAFPFTAAGETAPTPNLKRRHVALAWARAICNYLITNDPADTQAKASLAEIRGEIKGYEFEHVLSFTTKKPVEVGGAFGSF